MAAAWMIAPAPHFEVYSNAGAEATRALASGFERLHAFFARQLGVAPRQGPVRVIGFATEAEFAEFRLKPDTAAFNIGGTGGDYIVMPVGARADLRIPAHEFAHLLIRSTGWKLPPWLAEGIPEVASTLRIGEHGSFVGGESRGRAPLLKSGRLMPLEELLARDTAESPMFYAQSWALTDMLLFSPKYAAGFPAFVAATGSGMSSERALAAVYHTGLEAVAADLRARIAHPIYPVGLAGLAAAGAEIPVHEIDGAALIEGLRGTIAFDRGDKAGALAFWKRAIELGTTDAGLCYRYAILADDRAALERTLSLDPGFDDARFKLALLEKNAGHAEEAVAQLRAMREIAPERAFAYWSAMADALLDLGRREEARQAAARASTVASTDAERTRAAELAWIAESELAVVLDKGQARTVRVPLDAAPRNPFIEPGDRARTTEGTLEEVECGDGGLKVKVRAAARLLTLSIPDPSRVQIRNAGGVKFELTCGPQKARRVVVDYSADGVLRGLELR